MRADRRKLIDEYKIQHGCKCCGANTNASELELHCRDLSEKDVIPSKLLQFSREHLLEVLESSDVVCAKCHRRVHEKTYLTDEGWKTDANEASMP